MASTQLPEFSNGLTSPTIQSISMEAGRQCHGNLWSNLREVCELLRIPCPTSSADSDLLFQHVQFKTGQRIHTIGQAFDTFYVVNSGFLKTVSIDEFGNGQVLSFPMRGDLLGIDGIHTKRYASEAVALSDCSLILVPFKNLMALGHSHIEFEHAIYGVMSRELIRKQALLTMLGALSAEARVARFLISLSDKYAEIGYSGKRFTLRMTRQEIGSYLGLSLETVSRTLSALNEIDLISVDQRAIRIKDREMLKILRRIPPSKTRSRPTITRKLQADANWPHPIAASLVN
jgi:CRP/FNR family transcriptional regulator